MIPDRLLTCTNRQARRSLRSSPCDSNSVFEWADTVYKYASNRLKSSANVRGAISPAQSADITVAGGNNDAYFALLLDSIICFIYNGLAFIYLYIVDSKKIKVLRDGGISS